MSNNCKQCLFCCHESSWMCEDFAALEENLETEELIESERIEFRNEWFKYIENNEE